MTNDRDDFPRKQLKENLFCTVWNPGKGKFEKKTFPVITDRCYLSTIQLGNGLVIEMNVGTGEDVEFVIRYQ